MKLKAKSLILMVLLIALLILFGTNVSAAEAFKIDKISAIVNDTNAKIEWTNVEGANGYEVYVELPAIGYQYIGTVKSNNVQIIGFEKGTTYGVKVRAYKENGSNITYSDFSEEVKFKYGEDTITISDLGQIGKIEAISYGTTGSLKWEEVTNADGYQIYASVGNGSFFDMGTTTSTELKVIGMDKTRVYTIKIRPFMEISGERIYGSFSEPAILKYEDSEPEIITIGTVNNFNVSISGTIAYLTWNSVSDVDGYEVLVEMPEGTDAVYSVDTNKLTLQNFTAGYTYKAKVRAYKYVNGEKVYGNYSTTKDIKIEKEEEEIKVDTVTNLSVSLNGQTAKITWNKVSGASGYEIEIDDPDRGTLITTTTTTSKTISGFNNHEENYSVRVRAYKNVDGRKVYGNYSSRKYFKVEQEKPDKVTGVEITIDDDDAKITWDRVSGADGYEVRIYEPGEGYSTTRTSSTSKTIYNLDYDAGKYSVQIRAYFNEGGERVYGDYSSKEYFRAESEKPDEVTDIDVTVDDDNAKITWDRVSGADGYEVRVYEPGEGYSTYRTTNRSKTLYNLDYSSTRYYVQVRAYIIVDGEREYGEYSSKEYFRIEREQEKPDRVTDVEVSVSDRKAKITWDRVSEADGYEVRIYEPGEGYSTTRTTSTSKTVSNLSYSSSRYSVQVRAYIIVDGEREYGEYSSKEYFRIEREQEEEEEQETSKTPSQVTGVKVTRNGNNVTFSWNKASNASGYQVKMYERGIATYSANVTGTSKTVIGVPATTTYTVKVRAYTYVNGNIVYGPYSTSKTFN